MKEWYNCHIYYTDLDSLILACVNPIFERQRKMLDRCFWERHYAGGAHLRIRLYGHRAALRFVVDELERASKHFIATNPSAPVSTYSAAKAMKLLQLEDEYVPGEDLSYRVNTIETRPYERLNHRLASDESAHLLADFYHDAVPLAIALMQSRRPRMHEALRLYFLEALFISDALSEGSVAFKSHWEGFAAFSSTDQLNERIAAKYNEQQDTIRRLMYEVKERFDSKSCEEDRILSMWHDLLTIYNEKTQSLLAEGRQLTFQLTDIRQGRGAKAQLDAQPDVLKKHPFLGVLWGDERFVVSFQYEPRLLRKRVVTNLLYAFVTNVGLTFIDRMTLCYCAHRTVEDSFGVDLTDILRSNVKIVVDRNKHRFSEVNE